MGIHLGWELIMKLKLLIQLRGDCNVPEWPTSMHNTLCLGCLLGQTPHTLKVGPFVVRKVLYPSSPMNLRRRSAGLQCMGHSKRGEAPGLPTGPKSFVVGEHVVERGYCMSMYRYRHRIYYTITFQKIIGRARETIPLPSVHMPFVNQLGMRPPRTRRPNNGRDCTCPIPAGPISKFQPNIFRAGNMNTPGSAASAARRHASSVYTSSWFGRPSGKTLYFTQKINVFGQVSGAPGGTGRKPSNTLLR